MMLLDEHSRPYRRGPMTTQELEAFYAALLGMPDRECDLCDEDLIHINQQLEQYRGLS